MNSRQHWGIGLTGLLTAGVLLVVAGAEAAPKDKQDKEMKAARCVVVWSEGTAPRRIYPDDINGAVAESLKSLEGWHAGSLGPRAVLAGGQGQVLLLPGGARNQPRVFR